VQPLQTSALPQAGTYTSTFRLSNTPLTFSVLSDHKQLAHVQANANGIGVDCAPGGYVPAKIIINTFPLNADGSFNGKSTQHIIVGNANATVNETFQGHFHGIGMSKAARAAGVFTVTVTWTDANNTQFFCTNTTHWRATLSGP
jgi:hypothetical protein